MTRTPRPLGSLALLVALTAASLAAAQPGGSLTRFDAATDWPAARKMFQPLMPRAGRSISLDADGVVIATAPGKNPGPHELQAERTVAGDFQMDVRYDLVDFPDGHVDGGYGLTAGICAEAGPKYEAVKTGRIAYKAPRPTSYVAVRKTPARDDAFHYASAFTPSAAR